MSSFRAIIDANVLYSAQLRDLAAEFAVHDFFRPLWSNEILRETQVALDKYNPAAGKKFPRVCHELNSAFPDALVSKFDHLVETLNCPDPNDNHVLAAAIVGEAGALVTFNVSDFPQDLLSFHGIEVRHPDDFLQDLVDLSPKQAVRAIGRLLASYSRPALRAFELAQYMHKQNCRGFASFLLGSESEIDEAMETLLQGGA